MAICAGCNAVHTWGAAAIGLVAGIAYLAWSNIVLKVFRVDDPLDAFAGKHILKYEECLFRITLNFLLEKIINN